MLTLLLALILGIVISYFAVNNTAAVSVYLASYFVKLPLYVVVIASLFLGFLIAFIFSVINSISTGITLFGKDLKIRKEKENTAKLSSRISSLEAENARLREKKEKEQGRLDSLEIETYIQDMPQRKKQKRAKSKKSSRPIWHWIVFYLILGISIYLLIYYLIFIDKTAGVY